MPAAIEIAVRGTALVYALAEGVTVTVGRIGQCEIHLEDQAVSRRHCTLTLQGSSVLVTDLASANGTFLNDVEVTSAAAGVGDVVRVGSTVLEFRDPAAPAHSASGTARMAVEADKEIESVIRRRIDPADVEWLSSGTSVMPALELLQRAQRHLKTLHRVSESLAGARDLQALAAAALETILEVTAADRAALVLRRDGSSEVAATRQRSGLGGTFMVSRTIVNDTVAKGVSIFARDAREDERFARGQSVIGQGIRSVMCVPLRTTDEVLGALYVDSQSGPGRFSDEDLELLAAIGNHTGVAIHRVRLLGEIERLLLDTVRAIAATIDAKDGYTHRHSERVAALASRIAAEMGLGGDQQELAELSALLHDVGKIAVPDSILNKPDRLTGEEFAEMRKHPVHGARILSNIQSPMVSAVLPGVRYHHERWDGSGYPEGLRGDAIPLLGRLLGVADYLDALTSARAYHQPRSLDEVVDLIARGSGVLFDPQIAAAVVRLHARGGLAANGVRPPSPEPDGGEMSGVRPRTESASFQADLPSTESK